jgi:transcriptional regulator of acetoin/glycerol metabolism
MTPPGKPVVRIFGEDGHIRTLIEADVIRLALSMSGGSLTGAARSLRIDRSTLYRKLENLRR